MTFDPEKHLIKVKGGAEYLEAKWRLVWLRDLYPNAMIETQHIELSDEHAIFRATVTFPDGGGAMGYGSETKRDFGDYIEKAETKAIARALAAAGFGTQFTGDELAEGERIVDSPVQRSQPQQQAPMREQMAVNAQVGPPLSDAQLRKIWVTAKNDRKFTEEETEAEAMRMFGRRVGELGKHQASEFIEWLVGSEAEASPHSMVQQAIDNREANYLAAIEGAGSMGELRKIGEQIAGAGIKSDALTEAYKKQRAMLEERAA